MSNRNWFDDYMGYQLSGCEVDGKPAESDGCLPWVLGVLVVLWIVSKLFY